MPGTSPSRQSVASLTTMSSWDFRVNWGERAIASGF
jgi:hypothetical protein